VTRVYVPLNRGLLESALEHRELGPAPLAAFAVTPELGAATPDLDVEELEYAAYRLAVDASRAMLAPDRTDDRRRLVVAADVTVTRPDADGGPGAITVPEPIPWAQVAAVHADPTDAAGDDDDLAWYATQEAPELLR
jgi:hypothetical protein